MKVAVIVSTYNRPDALVKVLDGLLSQTHLPDEIIVADDGSTTETASVLKRYLSGMRVVQIKHVWQEDKGFRLACIRNKAILATDSTYLIFLDGDCIPERHFVEDHLDLAENGHFFQGKRVIVEQQATERFTFSDTCKKLKLLKLVATSQISNCHHIFRLRKFPSYTTQKMSGIRGCNMGFFKEDLVSVNGFNTEFTGWGREDSEIVVRLYRYGIKRKEHPFRAICYHLWHLENKNEDVVKNDQRLKETQDSDTYFCRKGITDK